MQTPAPVPEPTRRVATTSTAPALLRGRVGLVVFTTETGAWWSRFLPAPWRHCFVLFALTSPNTDHKPTDNRQRTRKQEKQEKQEKETKKAGRVAHGWLLLDPCQGRTELSWLTPAVGARLLNRLLCDKQTAVVPWKYRSEYKKTEITGEIGGRYHRFLASLPLGGCVWQVQQALGIPTTSFTPSGLHRRLTKDGQKRLHKSERTKISDNSRKINNKKIF